jgi:general L-amino acid transport system substrate-binding protein
MPRFLYAVLLAGFAAATAVAVPASARSGLEEARERGHFICGLRSETVGFARKLPDGRFTGLEVDICSAVAIAVAGPSVKLSMVPLAANERLETLKSGKVDFLVSGTTLTYTRDTDPGLRFAAVYYYDTQGIMVPRKAGKQRATELNGFSICVTSGTTSESNLDTYFRNNKMTFKAMPVANAGELRDDFFKGKCQAVTADSSALYAARAAYASNPDEFSILRDFLSKEPLAAITRSDDERFTNIVRWAIAALIHAEEEGITSRNIDATKANGSARARYLLGATPGIGKPLGLADDWFYNVVKVVGNYGEIFERNLGAATPLRINRGLNTLWSQGGMMYSPPFN